MLSDKQLSVVLEIVNIVFIASAITWSRVLTENIKKGKILGNGYYYCYIYIFFFFGGGESSEKTTASRGPCEKNWQLKGGGVMQFLNGAFRIPPALPPSPKIRNGPFVATISASLQWYRWNSIAIPPVVLKSNGVLALFPCLGLPEYLVWIQSLLDSAFGWQILTTKKSELYLFQNP